MKTDQTEIGYFFSKTFFALISAAAIFSLLFFPKSAGAAVKCEVQYGGKQVCVATGQIQTDKKVCDPRKGSCDPFSDGFAGRLVDNMGPGDYLFAPGEEVVFRITVKNVGDAALSNVAVTDTPQAGFLEPTADPLNFNFSTLNPGEAKSKDIRLKVMDSQSIPSDSTICLVNTAAATGDSNVADRDTAQLCLGRKVLGKGVVEVPKTGMRFILWIISGGLLVAGFKLRKFALNPQMPARKDLPSDIYLMRNLKKNRR